MNTQKHTQGPWRCVDTSNHAHDYRLLAANGAPLPLNVIANDHSEQRANAHLIAAAPELLQVTKDFLLLAALHDWEGAAIDFAKATLAKAEGVK
jgi:hypothetical protein